MPDRGDGRRVSKVTMRDPYSVLGVKKDARDDEIKAAWRARAKSVHPDHNASDPLAASRFAEIGAAYDLLKDPEKRRRYDARRRKADGDGEQTIMQKRQAEREAAARAKAAKAEADRVMEELARANAQRAAKAAKETTAEAGPETPEAMVNRIFGGGKEAGATQANEASGAAKPAGPHESTARPQAETATGAKAAQSGPDLEDINPQEDSRAPGAPLSVQAVEFISNWIRRLRGREAPPEKAPDMRAEVVISLFDLIKGGKAEVQLPDGRDIRFLMQPGLTDGHVVTFEGHGLRVPGMLKGDLFVTVRIAPDARFRTEGFDIHTILPVTLENAVLGCDCTVETPEGPVEITVPAWSDSNRSIRLAGKGLRETIDRRGDLVVEIRLILWDKPDDKVTDLMRHMREGLFI
ncbi:MAG: DnaJ domain-containing protein [Proteobacteria bacterium]|nr:DnaJ domain-containing protein [Pseudomonadota bacterium]